MLLGDLGAEIIKVEEPSSGDDTRGYPPFDKGFSAYFANLNRNKKSVALDLKDPQGKKALWDLIGTADVIVENYKPGTMARLGFSYEAVKAVRPGMVFGSISGFGQYGPYAERPGYDIIGQAMGGLMSVTGWPDSPPSRSGTAIGDILAGLNCAIGILASLLGRERGGGGDHVDVSLVDCAVSAMETLIQIYLVEGRVPGRIGNRYEFIYPYDTFPASDGWVVIAVGNDTVWSRFCDAIGRPDLSGEQRFAKNADRVKAHEELGRIVSTWSSARRIEDIVDLLLSKSVPCAPIYGVDDIVSDPHIAGARGMIVDIPHPLFGGMRLVACPIKLTERPAAIVSAAPTLGQHTAEVLAGLASAERAKSADAEERIAR